MKNFAKLLCLVLCLTLVLTAASVAMAESGATDELAYTGTITMYAQALSPDEPTETNPNPPTAFRTVAEEYQKLHPGITIEFIPQLTGGQDYLTWLKTRIAGGGYFLDPCQPDQRRLYSHRFHCRAERISGAPQQIHRGQRKVDRYLL